jgi:hypothetical protein
MRWIRLWILFAGLALLLVPLRAAAQDLGTLDGTWQGDLAVIRTPTTVGPGRPYTVRIVITGATAHVFARDTSGGPFQEVKPGIPRRPARTQRNNPFYGLGPG